MKLISSKKTKRRIALMFIFAFMLSNLLSLFGPSAQAAVTITAPSAGTCFQHSGTVVNGALVTVYNIGTIQLSLTASEISPGQDSSAAVGSASATGQAAATSFGSISTNSDVTGNVFTIVPPTGTNFVIVPGFQDTGANKSNHLLASNATIANASSQDATNGAADDPLGISVGIITAGTAGIGRAIVAIARDADSTTTTSGTAGNETYPKSGTGNNTATISITGLGIAIPPSGTQALSGTLQATFDGPPSGVGTSAGLASGAAGATVSNAIPGLSGTINLCTVTSVAGKLEAVLDNDNDSTELYDNSGTTNANLLALGQISSNVRVWALDTATVAAPAGVSGTSLVDLEPILIKGTGTTVSGVGASDQVIATAELLNNITAAGLAPSGAASPSTLDLATYFNNSAIAPITIAFQDDNASATSSLLAVDIIIAQSTAGATPTAAGYNAAQSSRSGFLGALRAATFDQNNATTNTNYQSPTADNASGWGVVSVNGGPGTVNAQESNLVRSNNVVVAGLGAITGNATFPLNNTFVDLRLECGASTNPISGWFAILNSTAANFGTTNGTQQLISLTQAGQSFLVNSTTTLYTQGLTNIAGSNPIAASAFMLGTWAAAADGFTTAGNALLYATCTNNTLTIVPISGGFDNTRDIISVSPLIQVTNVGSTFSSDVNLLAEISGNNLSSTATTLMLAKLVGVPTTGGTSTLASAEGVALASNNNLGVDCSSGSVSSVVLSSINSGTVDTQVTAACTSGTIAKPSNFFTGGVGNSVSGSTVVDGSPTVQGEGRGVLVKELSATGFNELVSQVGGGTQGTIFEIQLPTGCDVIDDRDDNSTAASTTASAGGNDVSMVTITSTAGVTAGFLQGAGDAALTSSNALEPASGSNPAKVRFRVNAVGGATDAATTDAILVQFNAQDILCPTTVTGDLKAKVIAANKVSGPTLTSTLGTASLGEAKQAFTVSFADDVATSTKLEASTNKKIGPTPRLVGGSTSNSHTINIAENDTRSIPIGGRTAARLLDPDNSVLSTVLSRGQIWIVPAQGTAFSAAPAAADVSFSDNSLVVDGNPLLATTSTVDGNAPLGTIIVGVKKNTASGAADPTASTTTITVKGVKLTAATSSTTDLVSSVLFFSQDAGVVVNTPGSAAGNSGSTPTVFTPYAPGSTKAATQINGTTVAAATVQLGSGTLANQLLTSRLTSQGSPQLNPFAKVVTSAKNADASKISVSSAVVSSGGTPATDNVITVTGVAGAVDNGAEVVITTGGSTTYDSVTVVASDDGSFTGVLRGDCATSSSVSVSVTEQVSGTKTTSVTKTALCGGGSGGETADDVFNQIAGSDGSATVAEVLSFVTAQGGLAAIITSGGSKLSGVIKAAKAALGLS